MASAEKNGKNGKTGKYVLYPDTLKVAKFDSHEEAATVHETDPNAIVLRKRDMRKLRKRLKRKL
jgi:hypothetical protein